MSSSWSDLPLDIGQLILDRLPEVVEYVRFGVVCKHWYAISKEYAQQQHRISCRRSLPMLLVPSPNAPAKPDPPKLYALSCFGKYYQNLNHPLRFTRFRYCGSSNGWLAAQNEDFTFTLLYPFAGELHTIHLPVLYCPSLAQKHDLLTKKLIVSQTSTPDDYIVVAIYGDDRKLATIKSGDESWFRFKIPDIHYAEIIFYRNNVYAVAQSFQMVSINVHTRPPRFRIIHPRVESVASSKTYLVESSSSELFLLEKRLIFKSVFQDIKEDDSDNDEDEDTSDNEDDDYSDNEDENEDNGDNEEEEDDDEEYVYDRRWSTKEFCVYKLKLDKRTGDVVERIETKSLNGDAFFVGDNASMSFPAARFPGCKPNCIYFTDNYIYRYDCEPFGLEDVLCYNVEDGNMENIYSVIPRHKRNMPQSIWIMPQYHHHHTV